MLLLYRKAALFSTDHQRVASEHMAADMSWQRSTHVTDLHSNQHTAVETALIHEDVSPGVHAGQSRADFQMLSSC